MISIASLQTNVTVHRIACFVPASPLTSHPTSAVTTTTSHLSQRRSIFHAPCRLRHSRNSGAATIKFRACLSSSMYEGENVTVRLAKAHDIREMAWVTARAFCEQDQMLMLLKSKSNPLINPLINLLENLYLAYSSRDSAKQLRVRVGPKQQAAHIVLVAEQSDTGVMMGCVEMGMVNKGKLGNARAGYAIEQWEKSIAEVSRMKRSASLLESGSASNRSSVGSINENLKSNSEETQQVANVWADSIKKDSQIDDVLAGKAPYIGNLAVLEEYRRRGIASKLVVEACRWSKTLWSSPCVWLHVEEDNEAATKLYRKLDFGCETQDPEWVNEVGRRKRLLLRSSGGTPDWTQAKSNGIKLNGTEYIRWCWNDLTRVRRENEKI